MPRLKWYYTQVKNGQNKMCDRRTASTCPGAPAIQGSLYLFNRIKFPRAQET
jgi:hypothetical protein